MAPRIVILDTNFLLVPFQFKINVIKELDYLLEVSHKFVISSQTIIELENLGKSKSKTGIAARLAKKILETNSIEVIKNDQHVDDWIVEYAKEHNAIVATNDTLLRKRLRPFKIKVVVVKSRSSLGFI
jgi:rRNA-processing protein FCF1